MPRRRRTAQELRQPRPSLPESVPSEYRGLAGFIAKDPEAFFKGAATMPFTVAPDLLGMATEATGALSKFVSERTGLPAVQFGRISGDPIREMVGLDPTSPQGIAGETVSPVGTVAKVLSAAGKSVMAGAKLAAGTDLPAHLAMTLFHGTPHKFKKFDLSKIGTGEGAQTFGYGLYFAESPGVAGSYKNALAAPAVNVDGTIIRAREMQPRQAVAYSAASEGSDALEDLIAAKKRRLAEGDPNVREEDIVFAESLRGKKIKREDQSHLYEVEIPDEITDTMLDWDAPLSEQRRLQDVLGTPEQLANRSFFSSDRYRELMEIQDTLGVDQSQNVRKELAQFVKDMKNATGEDVYRMLSRDLGGDEAASAFLKEKDIPGIRYYDAQSRFPERTVQQIEDQIRHYKNLIAQSGDSPRTKRVNAARRGEIETLERRLEEGTTGTRNVVVFNPDDITQVKRDGKLVYEAQPTTSGVGGRVFYRGTNPGDTRKIDEPFTEASGLTFMANKESSARLYGSEIERIVAKPDAKILDENSVEFWRVAGRRRPPNGYIGSATRQGESVVDAVNDVIKRAKQEGYDIVSFSSDADIGTVLLNEDAVIRPAKPTTSTKQKKARGGRVLPAQMNALRYTGTGYPRR